MGGGEQQVGAQGERFDVDIGLVEAVEEHQAIGAGRHQSLGQGRQVCVEGRQLHRQRQRHLGAHLPHDLLHLGFDGGAAEVGVGGHAVDVELDGAGARGLQAPGRRHPAAGPGAVEAGDHGNGKPLARLFEVAQVEILAAMKERRFGEIIEGFGIAVAALLRLPPEVELLALDLLLEQRMQHHRGGAGVLQAQQGVEVLAQGGGGAGHQGGAQGQAQPGGGEVGSTHGAGGEGESLAGGASAARAR